MIRIGVIGGGAHSRSTHLPALAEYAARHPAELQLAAFCDLRPDVRDMAAHTYGFARCYDTVEALLAANVMDGCVAVTPVAVTAGIARKVIEAGVWLLMEKPPGATVEEATALCAFADRAPSRVMVSMNRRFDPAVSAACAQMGDAPPRYVRATLARVRRRESTFITDTGIHALDTLRKIAGDVRDMAVRTRIVDGASWYGVDLEFTSGALGRLDVLPTAGYVAESYEVFGAGYRILARAGANDGGDITVCREGRVVLHDEPARGLPVFVQNGTYAETVEFITAIKENRPPHPAPSEVLQSVVLCHAIEQSARQA